MPKKSNIVFTDVVKNRINVVRKDELLGEPVAFRKLNRQPEIAMYANKGLRYAVVGEKGGKRLSSLLEIERFAANYEDEEIIQTRSAARRINSLLEYMTVPEIVEQFNREEYYLQFNPGKQWTYNDVRVTAGKANWLPLWLKSLKRRLWKMSKKF